MAIFHPWDFKGDIGYQYNVPTYPGPSAQMPARTRYCPFATGPRRVSPIQQQQHEYYTKKRPENTNHRGSSRTDCSEKNTSYFIPFIILALLSHSLTAVTQIVGHIRAFIFIFLSRKKISIFIPRRLASNSCCNISQQQQQCLRAWWRHQQPAFHGIGSPGSNTSRSPRWSSGYPGTLLALVLEFDSHRGEILTSFAKIANEGSTVESAYHSGVGGYNSTRVDEERQMLNSSHDKKITARTVVGRGEKGPPCNPGSEFLLGGRRE